MSIRLIRLERLFNRNENAVIIAADHGMFDGPIPGLVDIRRTLEKINPAVDAVLVSPGTLKHCADTFNTKGAPMAVVRVNWSTVYCFHWKYDRAATVPACSVGEAVSLGADIVLVSLTLKTGDEAVDAKNVEVFARQTEDAHRLGIPVVGEFFPTHSDSLTPDEMQEQVMTGSRILAELGADLIKTFYTKDFARVTAGCPVPVLGLGAERKPTQVEALRLAKDEIAAGARGVVFGRNAIQVEDPKAFQAALCDVVKRGLAPEEAAKRHRLKE